MSYQVTEQVLASGHPEVKGTELLVLIVLATHAHEDGTSAFPAVETIAAKARVTRRTVQYALRRLEQRELVRE